MGVSAAEILFFSRMFSHPLSIELGISEGRSRASLAVSYKPIGLTVWSCVLLRWFKWENSSAHRRGHGWWLPGQHTCNTHHRRPLYYYTQVWGIHTHTHFTCRLKTKSVVGETRGSRVSATPFRNTTAWNHKFCLWETISIMIDVRSTSVCPLWGSVFGHTYNTSVNS